MQIISSNLNYSHIGSKLFLYILISMLKKPLKKKWNRLSFKTIKYKVSRYLLQLFIAR